MTDQFHEEAAALQHALHLALQIDPAKTTDPILLEAWHTATLLKSALDCYRRAAARVQACDLDVARAIAEGDANYWASEVRQLGERLMQLHANRSTAAATRKGSA